MGAAAAAWGADPQSYKARLNGDAAKEIQTTLAASSDLLTLRKSAPVSPLGLVLRARGDTVRLKVVLESYGYYQSAVTATIDGEPLVSADLADKLAALPPKTDANVVVSYISGPLYHLGTISIEGDLPEAMRAQLPLRTGQPAVAADVLAAGNRLLRALQDQGYAFAKVDPPVAYERPETRVLDVSFQVTTGSVARIGAIQVTGLKRTRLPTVLARLGMKTGDQYSAQAIDRARRNLLAMGVFGSVDISIATAADPDGSVPVTFRLSERKRHAVTLNAAYSTDLGISGGVTWADRNLFGHAEQLTLSASIINVKGSATTGVGYDTSAQLVLPEFLHSQQNLQVSLTAIEQYLDAYDQKAETLGFTLTRTLSRVWTLSAGFTTTVETIVQKQQLEFGTQDTFYYTLFALPVSLSYDSTDLSSPLLDPTHGIRAALTVSPTLSLGPPDATFIISQIRAATYFDLHDLIRTDPGRTVLALRGLTGYVRGASVLELPPDQRFYAGGSGTVRGYRYQSIGDQFTDGTPRGGVGVDVLGIELRQRVGRNFGFGIFSDAGRVSQDPVPFRGAFEIGVGAGLRYYTPIGPLRLDFAVPLHKDKTDPMHPEATQDRFELYIGLGQAF